MAERPMTHDLKTWPDPFQAVWEGRKYAEFRADDRGFQVGDDLLLREYDPETAEYSGRFVRVTITDISRAGAFGIPEGYAMLSFLPTSRGMTDG